MNINTDTMVPISVANQNFSKVARLVDQFGSAVILKNNAPRYIIYEFNQADAMQAAADDEYGHMGFLCPGGSGSRTVSVFLQASESRSQKQRVAPEHNGRVDHGRKGEGGEKGT